MFLWRALSVLLHELHGQPVPRSCSQGQGLLGMTVVYNSPELQLLLFEWRHCCPPLSTIMSIKWRLVFRAISIMHGVGDCLCHYYPGPNSHASFACVFVEYPVRHSGKCSPMNPCNVFRCGLHRKSYLPINWLWHSTQFIIHYDFYIS